MREGHGRESQRAGSNTQPPIPSTWTPFTVRALIQQFMSSLRLQGLQRARSLALNQRRTLFSRAAPPPPNPLRTGLYATAFAITTGLFAVYYFDARSALHRYVITPIVRHSFDAETGHKIAVKVLRSGLGPKDPVPDDEKLEVEVRLQVKLSNVTLIERHSYGEERYPIQLALQLALTKMGKPWMDCLIWDLVGSRLVV